MAVRAKSEHHLRSLEDGFAAAHACEYRRVLIDDLMPRFDFIERHEIDVEAPASVAYRAARSFDMVRSAVVLALMAVRGIPHLLSGKFQPARHLTIETLLENGFSLIREEPGVEIVIGVVGKFWRPDSGVLRITGDQFIDFDEAGYAKALWNFRVDPDGSGRSKVTTETRIACTDGSSRRKFGAYWMVVGPFSALIRRLMLRQIRRAAESERSGSPLSLDL